MKTELLYNEKTYQFYRYPAKHQHKTLQAWGAEDEYVMNHLLQQQQALGKILILNDDFGVIGCLLNNAAPTWQQDSYVAHCALQENISRNSLESQVSALPSTKPLDGVYDTVLIKLPRNLNYLRHQLQMLRQHLHDDSRVLAFGKVKAVTTNVLQIFESVLGKTHTSLAVKKARLIFCHPDPSKLSSTKNQTTTHQWTVDAEGLDGPVNMTNLANVFSGQTLDIGARFLLKHLRINDNERVLDLGCGNGILGLSVLINTTGSKITFVDESFMAVESARLNVRNNTAHAEENCTFVVDNCLEKHLSGTIPHTYDTVLCNPPFHQQNTVTDHIAWQMFSDAKQTLRKGGRLIVVGNRHLGYHDKLKRLFGGVKVLASEPKFVILLAVRR
ncbi:methyltransferase domain-containing protein [Alteromonas sediminis]|uniref:Ribosomal RNA large subunit methyltransferase G n=1 Tax=Alteromonas sediminis TaxID=2259342 RepID=A0A3N5Y0H7_9ALTE|nr:methyltransferase [Alteromonas sediminis]RPJ65996.1 methyltransferase domain-containing protein [Alteromonas sediminis]